VTASTPCHQLRELRLERGWTQQEVAERLARLAWLHHRQHVGVNTDMVSKWERGAKGISARYRELLCVLFGVTAEQLGLAPAAPGRQSSAQDGTLLSVLDGALSLLDQLGRAGAVLEPQMFAVWKEQVAGRRTVLAMLDPGAGGSQPARQTRSTPATADELDELADRYRALYDTVAPAALLTSVVAHVRMTDEALHESPSPAERRRLLANRARVAILAGRLAFDDLGNAMAARAHYSLALDAAHEAGDDNLTAAAHGYAAQLAAPEHQPAAALNHLAAARRGRIHPLLASWLTTIEATIRADTGDHAAALDAIDAAQAILDQAATASPLPWFDDHDPARLAAATGHVLLRAEHYDAARDALADALGQIPRSVRRARILCLIDQAATELGRGDSSAACRFAGFAAELLRNVPHSLGIAKLRALRADVVHPAANIVLREIDEQLAKLDAA